LRQIEKKFENETARYSNWTLKSNKKILLIDSIGKLANAYNYGQIAFIGGGFSGNLHNILEPAVFGLPVIFGPKHKRFPEAQTFIDAGIGFSVANEEALNFAFNNIIQNQENLKIKTTDLVLDSQGATNKILDHLQEN
jgi:3-deoxy-D-manno-octulosonic-acid transferase